MVVVSMRQDIPLSGWSRKAELALSVVMSVQHLQRETESGGSRRVEDASSVKGWDVGRRKSEVFKKAEQ